MTVIKKAVAVVVILLWFVFEGALGLGAKIDADKDN